MPTIDEKRVYTNTVGTETVYLGSELGVLGVTVSDAVVGEFGLAYRGAVRDIATAGPYVAAATDDGVLLADHRRRREDAGDESNMDELQFYNIGDGIGSVSAVGFETTTQNKVALIAGETSGDIYRLTMSPDDIFGSQPEMLSTWNFIDTCSTVYEIDMPLIATAEGVFQVTSDAPSGTVISYAGLDTAHDIDAEPVAATTDGLYVLANGWIKIPSIEQAESVDIMRSSDRLVRAHAVCGGSLYACNVSNTAGLVPDMGAHWKSVNLPVTEPIMAVTHSHTTTYAVTTDGTLAACVDITTETAETTKKKPAHRREAEWQHRSLGVTGVSAIAVSHNNW